MKSSNNKMYVFWLLIMSILLLLPGCNEGGGLVIAKPSNLKAISAFSLISPNGPVNGIIIGDNISLTVPYKTNLKSLIATFTTSGVSVSVNGVRQVSGVTPNNFTSRVSYVVTAADGSTRNYTVTVIIAASDDKAITAFSLDGTPGTISGSNVVVKVPYKTSLKSLIATFTTSGVSVSVNGVRQVSGVTPNNFTSRVSYVVTAADGSMNTYVVTVTVPITLFSCINDPVTSNSCGCLKQNDGSGLVWYADASQNGTWYDWCSHTGSSSDHNCNSNGKLLVAFNNAKHCGYNDWHLPTAPNASSAIYIDQMGGDWGALGTYAKNNGWTEGSPFYIWLNSSYFINVANSPYWSSQPLDKTYAYMYVVYMSDGNTDLDYIGYDTGVMLVHVGQ